MKWVLQINVRVTRGIPNMKALCLGVKIVTAVFVFGLIAKSSSVEAVEVGVGLGWHDPHGTELGVNALFIGQTFGLGLGVGSVATESDKSKSEVSLSGDVTLMWLFSSTSVRPFLRIGLPAGGDASNEAGAGIRVGADGPFGGAGLLLSGSKVFGYVGADLEKQNEASPFAGIGMKI